MSHVTRLAAMVVMAAGTICSSQLSAADFYPIQTVDVHTASGP